MRLILEDDETQARTVCEFDPTDAISAQRALGNSLIAIAEAIAAEATRLEGFTSGQPH